MNGILKSANLLVTRLKAQTPITFLAATICSKELRDPDYKKPKPFPYETKRFSIFQFYIDNTLKRFDENTKVIVVDGNIGAGKTSFAKELAKQFDMLYIPEPSVDRYYITPYGDDLRKLDSIMPLRFRSCDIKTFYENPMDPNVAQFQCKMLVLRYVDYIQALAHVLNTGQGVVMDRSAYSDFVFMEAMHKMGYVRQEARDFYFKLHDHIIVELLRPHLIVYLDVKPEVALQRIKERNNPIEVNSKVLTTEYLQAIEDYYKKQHLHKLRNHSEILVYDWNDYGDVEVVVEDIERIDFDTFDRYSERFTDWYLEDNWEYGAVRYKYTTQMSKLLNYTALIPFDVPELMRTSEDVLAYREILKKVPGMQYAGGFNPHMGDSTWFRKAYPNYKDQVNYFPQLS